MDQYGPILRLTDGETGVFVVVGGTTGLPFAGPDAPPTQGLSQASGRHGKVGGGAHRGVLGLSQGRLRSPAGDSGENRGRGGALAVGRAPSRVNRDGWKVR